MTESNLNQVLKFRVSQVVYDWWESKCNKQGVKKGAPFQKALELAYQKENAPDFSMQEISVLLEPILADKVFSHSKFNGVDPSTFIKNIVAEKLLELEKVNDALDVFEKTSRKELRLKPSLNLAIAEKATLLKMKPNQYIVSVLTANVTKENYFFGEDEILKLGESNSQLLAIGRNLNQIAKAMNQDIYEAYDRDFVGRVHELVKAHVKHVFLILERNKKRWE